MEVLVMYNSRKAELSINYEGKNITNQIEQYIKSIVYTDVASGSSDTITLELIDRDKKWMGAWKPSKGDAIEVIIYLHNWDKPSSKKIFKCGTFTGFPPPANTAISIAKSAAIATMPTKSLT